MNEASATTKGHGIYCRLVEKRLWRWSGWKRKKVQRKRKLVVYRRSAGSGKWRNEPRTDCRCSSGSRSRYQPEHTLTQQYTIRWWCWWKHKSLPFARLHLPSSLRRQRNNDRFDACALTSRTMTFRILPNCVSVWGQLERPFNEMKIRKITTEPNKKTVQVEPNRISNYIGSFLYPRRCLCLSERRREMILRRHDVEEGEVGNV